MTGKHKHTAGPWKAHLMNGVHGQNAILTEAPEFKDGEWPYHPKIASVACMRGGPPREIGDANARLIAAAPDLLEALKDVQGLVTYLATCAEPNDQYDEMIGPKLPEIKSKIEAAIARAEGGE